MFQYFNASINLIDLNSYPYARTKISGYRSLPINEIRKPSPKLPWIFFDAQVTWQEIKMEKTNHRLLWEHSLILHTEKILEQDFVRYIYLWKNLNFIGSNKFLLTSIQISSIQILHTEKKNCIQVFLLYKFHRPLEIGASTKPAP